MGQELKFLTVNLQSEIISAVKSVIPESQLLEVTSVEVFERLYEQWNESCFDIILCGPGWADLDVNEIGQNLRMKFRSTPLLFAAPETQFQSQERLRKNGFLDFFYWPMDSEHFSSKLRNLQRAITGTAKETFVGVSTYDLAADRTLDFDLSVYFPMNNKYVKLSPKGGSLTPEQINRLKDGGVSKVFIPESQLEAYHNCVAQLLKEYARDPDQSERLMNSVRDLFHNLLSPEMTQLNDGRELIDHAQKIVAALLPGSGRGNLFEDLAKKMGDVQSGFYRRSQRVATIAGLLALGMGHKSPEDIVLAALFCDLGTMGLSEELHKKPCSEMSKEEKALADSHINLSLQTLADKKMAIIPLVRQIVLQHHERFDGGGYPQGLKGHKVSVEAQILSLALQIDDLTCLRPGQVRLGPIEALSQIESNGSINPDIIRQIKNLLKTKGPAAA